MKTVFLAIGILFVFTGVIYICNKAGAPKSPVSQGAEGVISYEGSVYYFEATSTFGEKLGSFIKAHPELRIVSIAPLDNGSYGSTRGYWVVVEKREVREAKSTEK